MSHAVVIVDDEPPARARIARLLSHHADFQLVAQAGSVDEAVDALERYAPAVVFLDVQLGSRSENWPYRQQNGRRIERLSCNSPIYSGLCRAGAMRALKTRETFGWRTTTCLPRRWITTSYSKTPLVVLVL
jgi:CheY-like chemotaxis protein